MKKIKIVFALLLLTGVMGIAAIPSISPAYADEESKCGLCNCYIPMEELFGRVKNEDCVICECYIEIE
jgi:hypothetical protein